MGEQGACVDWKSTIVRREMEAKVNTGAIYDEGAGEKGGLPLPQPEPRSKRPEGNGSVRDVCI